MKIQLTYWITIATTILSISTGKGEVFLGSSNSVNSLVIASNEVILISSFKSPAIMYGESSSVVGQINAQGSTNYFTFTGYTMVAPAALAGPATLTFPNGTNSAPVCISFKRLTGTSIHSAILSFSSQNITQITVPSGQTCHFFNPITVSSYDYSDAICQVSDGTNSANALPIYGGEEFTGPVTIGLSANVNGYSSSGCTVISYYFTDNFVSLPTGVVQSGTGSFMVSVEKSGNLIDWSPVILQPMSDDQQAFYRLKLSK